MEVGCLSRHELERRFEDAAGSGMLRLSYRDTYAPNDLREALLAGGAKKLTRLRFGVKGLREAGAKALSEALRAGACPELTSLDVGVNGLGGNGMAELGRALGAGACPALRLLNISDNSIGRGGMVALCDALRGGHCPQLTSLNVGGNDLLQAGGMAPLITALREGACRGLTNLNVGGNGLGEAGMADLSKTLTEGACPALTCLDVAVNGLNATAMLGLQEALQASACPNLTNLRGGRMDGCLSRHELERRLEDAVVKGAHVELLSYRDTYAPNDLREALLAGGAKKLTRLRFGVKGLREAGAKALSEALRAGACPELTSLDVGVNGLGGNGMAELGRALGAGACPALRLLNISDNSIGRGGMVALCDALRGGHCPQLASLNVGGNDLLQAGGMAPLITALREGACRGLTNLNVGGNGLGEAGMAGLSKTLTEGACPALTCLDVNANGLSGTSLTTAIAALDKALNEGCVKVVEIRPSLRSLRGEVPTPAATAVAAGEDEDNEVARQQLALIERQQIRQIREEERRNDANAEGKLAGARHELLKLVSKQEKLRTRVKTDNSLGPQIASVREKIELAERQLRVQQSARTISTLHINIKGDRKVGKARPATLLEGVQASIDYSRSGAAKRAAQEDLRQKKLKERQARAVRSLNLTDEQLDELRQAFARFDSDASGNISTRELASVMRMLGENPSVVEVAALAAQVDGDGSGEIEFSEFVELMAVKKGFCNGDAKLSAEDVAFLEGNEGDEAAVARAQAVNEKKAKQAALAAAVAKGEQAAAAAAVKVAQATEIKVWSGAEVKALKPAPLHEHVAAGGRVLGNCVAGQVYKVHEAAHDKGWLRLRFKQGWASGQNNAGRPLFMLIGDAAAALVAGQQSSEEAAQAATLAAAQPGPLVVYLHRTYAACPDVRIDGLWPATTVAGLQSRIQQCIGLHPLSQQLTFNGRSLDNLDATMDSLGIVQFSHINSENTAAAAAFEDEHECAVGTSGGDGVDLSTRKPLLPTNAADSRRSAAYVAAAVASREGLATHGGAVGRRLALKSLASAHGVAMPPNPRQGRAGAKHGDEFTASRQHDLTQLACEQAEAVQRWQGATVIALQPAPMSRECERASASGTFLESVRTKGRWAAPMPLRAANPHFDNARKGHEYTVYEAAHDQSGALRLRIADEPKSWVSLLNRKGVPLFRLKHNRMLGRQVSLGAQRLAE